LSILYSYEDLKRKIQKKPIDFLKLHELQIEIGKLGEAYVYQYECKKLKGTEYINKIDERKALDPANGYDILSYTRDGKPLYIEVKATTGTENFFYLSNHELETARRMKNEGLTYLVYFVQEVMSDNPKLEIVEDITSNENFTLGEYNWKVTRN
jgi:hypothetical protein